MKRAAPNSPHNKRRTRLEARASAEKNRVLKQGAALSGMPLEQFVVDSAYKAAQNLVKDQETRDSKRAAQLEFVTELLGSQQPDERSKNAAASYREIMGI